jgi:hypothetical protein
MKFVPMPRPTVYASMEEAKAAFEKFAADFHDLVNKYGLLGDVVSIALAVGEREMLLRAGCMGMDDVIDAMMHRAAATVMDYMQTADHGDDADPYEFPEQIG